MAKIKHVTLRADVTVEAWRGFKMYCTMRGKTMTAVMSAYLNKTARRWRRKHS